MHIKFRCAVSSERDLIKYVTASLAIDLVLSASLKITQKRWAYATRSAFASKCEVRIYFGARLANDDDADLADSALSAVIARNAKDIPSVGTMAPTANSAIRIAKGIEKARIADCVRPCYLTRR